MRVVYIRGNKIAPDPRVEKEINSLIKLDNINITVLAWDRTESYQERNEKLELPNGKVDIVRYGIPASWGGGVKANLLPMLEFLREIFIWLYKNRKNYECIHVCGLPTSMPVILIKTMFKKKMIYDIFDFYADLRKRGNLSYKLFKNLEIKIINKADATIICSEKRREQIKGSHPKKLEIIHNTPSLEQYKEVKEEDIVGASRKVKIAYIGCLIEDRYIDKLVEVVSSMKDVELHIGGFGVLEEYVKAVAEKNSNIKYYGTLPYNKALAIEKQCDIMVALYDPNIQNHKYAAPNKFYEALLLGKPLIMIKNTGMDDVIVKYDIGEIIDLSRDTISKELEEAIVRLINRKSEWNDISNKMKRLYNEKYSWDIMEKRLVDIYNYVSNIS